MRKEGQPTDPTGKEYEFRSPGGQRGPTKKARTVLVNIARQESYQRVGQKESASRPKYPGNSHTQDKGRGEHRQSECALEQRERERASAATRAEHQAYGKDSEVLQGQWNRRG